jgi:glucokinase
VLDEVAGHLAGAVALLAQTVDPEVIVLGGGVAEAGPGLLDAVRAALHRRAAMSPVLTAIDLADRVALVPDGVPAGALGAAVLARRHLADDAP